MTRDINIRLEFTSLENGQTKCLATITGDTNRTVEHTPTGEGEGKDRDTAAAIAIYEALGWVDYSPIHRQQ